MALETTITLALSLLALIGSAASWLFGAQRRRAAVDSVGIANYDKLSQRVTELEDERARDYQERAEQRQKLWQLERDYEALKRQNERLRGVVLLLVQQIRNEGLEPAALPDDYEEHAGDGKET